MTTDYHKKHIFLHLAKTGPSEERYVKEAFATNWIAPLGPNVEAFEKSIEQYIHTRHAAALSSGTAAIHLALLLLGIKPDDEVMVQSFTFCATANPITYLGAKPIFIDSEEKTWNMSPELLKKAIEDRIAKTKRKPKAIIAVDLYGMPAMLNDISEIAENYEIPLIEDSAEALGSCYNGRKCGSFGQYGILSFNGNKIITTSGGGALLCQTANDKVKALFYATQAREKEEFYLHKEIGYNYRLSNVCAGIGRGQMESIDEILQHHKMLHNTYKQALSGIEGIHIHDNPNSNFDSNFWLTNILIDENITNIDNRIIMRQLNTLNIETRLPWKPLHQQPVFANYPAYTNGTSAQLFNQGLCLPSGPCVSKDDAETIAELIKQIVKSA